MAKPIKTITNSIASYILSKRVPGSQYPATVERYHVQALAVEKKVINLPAVLVRVKHGAFDLGKESTHKVDLLCLDINEASDSDMEEAVQDLMDWVIDNLPEDKVFVEDDYSVWFVGNCEYTTLWVGEDENRPIPIGVITLNIGADL